MIKLLLAIFIFFECYAQTLADKEKFYRYVGLYRQGENLVNGCDSIKHRPKYSSLNELNVAKRTIVSNLQYIGLTHTIKLISTYSKLLELEQDEYKNIYTNLIQNSCSENLSLFSRKKLRALFEQAYKESGVALPKIGETLFFKKNITKLLNSRETKRSEFNNTLKNFTAFCSWNGEVDDYRLLSPYLANQFVMSHVFNKMSKKYNTWDPEYDLLITKADPSAERVNCENLICRKGDDVKFIKHFPRMLGSLSLDVDFNSMYCEHFRHQVLAKSKNERINELMKSYSEEEQKMVVMNYLSMVTQMPDIFNAVTRFDELAVFLRKNVESHWDQWAEREIKNNSYKLDYEESLQVDLISNINTLDNFNGKFKLNFKYTLGEFDRIFGSNEKIDAYFQLRFSKKYLKWFRRQFVVLTNKSKFHDIKNLQKDFLDRVEEQLQGKTRFFLTNLWNKQMGRIIRDELEGQILAYEGSSLNGKKDEFIDINVNLEFGLFALKFIRDKYKYNFYKDAIISKN